MVHIILNYKEMLKSSRILLNNSNKSFFSTFSSFQTSLPNKIGLLGLCEDRNSSFLPGPSKAPAKIREYLYSDSSNPCCEAGYDILTHLKDFGDWNPPSRDATQTQSQYLSMVGMILREK